MKRKIIKIDESKCNGCGRCIPDCPEGALQIVDGKAKLVSEALCDGLGACLGQCPTGALTIEEREVEAFDEEKAKENMAKKEREVSGCPGMRVIDLREKDSGPKKPPLTSDEEVSELRQWPIQLKLLNPQAPYFRNAELLVAADCVPFSSKRFHEDFLKGRTLVMFCPKLDNAYEAYRDKIADIIKNNDIRSITVVYMEVPCCTGTERIVKDALEKSGKDMEMSTYVMTLKGKVKKGGEL